MTAHVKGFPAPRGWTLLKSGVGTPDFAPLPVAVNRPASFSQTLSESYWRVPKEPIVKQFSLCSKKCSSQGRRSPKCWYLFIPFKSIPFSPPVTESDFAAKQPFPFVNSIQLQQWMHLSSRMYILPFSVIVNALTGHWTSHALQPKQYAVLFAIPLRWLRTNLSILE